MMNVISSKQWKYPYLQYLKGENLAILLEAIDAEIVSSCEETPGANYRETGIERKPIVIRTLQQRFEQRYGERESDGQ